MFRVLVNSTTSITHRYCLEKASPCQFLQRIPASNFIHFQKSIARSFATPAIVQESSNVAVLYQEIPPPEIDGIRKPKKESGYSDSGADIAYVLRNNGLSVITPIQNPNHQQNLDWVFPDTSEGIQQAINAGANILWANTPLFADHPLSSLQQKEHIRIVGNKPQLVHKFDDKWHTNCVLRDNNLDIANAFLVSLGDQHEDTTPVDAVTENMLREYGISLPCIIKPIRGRGSQGVMKVNSLQALKERTKEYLSEQYQIEGKNYPKYGTKYIVEQYLPSQEITVTVMPPGTYIIDDEIIRKPSYWALPIVERFNHENGIAPYSVIKAVITNSKVLAPNHLENENCITIAKQCEKAASIVGAVAPIRIDCRSDGSEKYVAFDLNMKPNMTGAGRPGRENQDSLTGIAAQAIGWNYFDLLYNILGQAWKVQ